jgi:hypothetical protein
VWASLRDFGGQRDAGDAGDRRHTINSMCSPYHAVHGNRKTSARKLDAVGLTDSGIGNEPRARD